MSFVFGRQAALIVLTGMLLSCDVEDPACDGENLSSDSGVAPSACIEFPPAQSLTDQSQITVRGTTKAADGDAISLVRVNGVDATSDDGFATWQAQVPLNQGSNSLVVTLTDSADHRDLAADSVTIVQQAVLLEDSITGVIDDATHQVLVLDSQLKAMVGISLENGARQVISSNDQGDGPAFREVRSMALAPANVCSEVLPEANRCALVTDDAFAPGTSRLLAVDLEQGDRAFISSAERGTGDGLGRLRAVAVTDGHLCPQALQPTSYCALVLDDSEDALVAINLKGDRAVVANDERGNGPGFSEPKSLVVDPENRCQSVLANTTFCGLAIDSGFGVHGVLAVDLQTGDRAVLSSGQADPNRGEGPVFDFPQAIALGNNNQCAELLAGETDCALVADTGLDAVVAVNLTNGNRALLSSNEQGSGSAFDRPQGVFFDAVTDQLLVVDGGYDGLLSVDSLTGNRSLLRGHPIGTGPALSNFVGIAPASADLCADLFEARVSCVLAMDQKQDVLLAVDLNRGDRRVLADNSEVGTGPELGFLSALVEAPDSHCAELLPGEVSHCGLLMDSRANTLLAVNLLNGDRAVLSAEADGELALKDSAVSLALLENCDSIVSGATTCVLANNLRTGKLLAIDLADGHRNVISSAPRGSSSHNLLLKDDCAEVLAGVERCALVIGHRKNSVTAINLETGQRTVIADANTGSGQALNALEAMILVNADRCANVLPGIQHCALVVDAGLAGIVAIDLASGQRTLLLQQDTLGAMPDLSSVLSLVQDEASGLLSMFDRSFMGLVLFDAASQQRVLTAWNAQRSAP